MRAGHHPPKGSLLAERQLEGRALEVVDQDEGVLGIDARVLGRRAEEVVGMRGQVLVDAARWWPPSSPPTARSAGPRGPPAATCEAMVPG